MSQNPEFVITCLFNKKEIEVKDNIAVLPLFPTDLYTIKTSVTKPNYTNKFRKAVRWDFGDGTIIEGSTATHHYNAPGKYKISCTFYDIERKPHQSEYYITVIVKEIIPLALSFTDEAIFNDDKKVISRSKINNLLSVQSTLGDNIKAAPPISVKRISESLDDNSYFDIKNEEYYHLKRYYSFLGETIDSSYKKNVIDKITLNPVETYSPKYSPLYITFEDENGIIKPSLYVYIESRVEDKSVPEYYNIYNPNASVLTSYIDNENDYYYKVKLNKCYQTKDLPQNSRFCGWISQFNIWYKDDYIGDKDLYFSYDMSKLKYNDAKLSPTSLNIPPLGIKISVEDSDNYSYALTSSGLFFEGNIENDKLNIDNYLSHNFYIDYKVEMYLAKYIENDSYNDKRTWSILKDEKALPLLTADNCDLKYDDSFDEFISRYDIKPLKTKFDLTLSAEDKVFTYSRNSLEALYGIRLPYKNYKFINLDDVLDAYMSHPMYDDKPVIRSFFKQLFETDELFEKINNKGFDFFDDIINHKTCYIKNLQSMLEMFDSSQLSYNLNSFDKINELRELTRLLSMQYTELFGRYEKLIGDIKINGDQRGAAVGDIIKPSDIIACDKDYMIRGIIRDNVFYPTYNISDNIVLYNDFNKESRLISFYGISPSIMPQNHDELHNTHGTEYYYKFEDYDSTWGWNLQLPEEFENTSSRGMMIDAYYSFYLYNMPLSYKRTHNFIDKDTIPYSKEPYTTYITKEEWDDLFGYTYDCIMKVLTYKLGLN